LPSLIRVRICSRWGVYAPAGGADRTALAQLKHIQIVPFDNLDKAISRVQHHQIDLLVAEGDAVRYWVNETSGKGYFVERLLRQEEKRALVKEVVQGREVRYLDWVMPGIISMNMMFGALFGVGYVIVRYRKNGVLKRLQATPVTPLQFICAQVLSRLSILLIIAVIIYAGCALFLDFLMLGSRLTLLLVAALGGLCMIALGLLVASRTESEELASGLLNFATWPMMFLSEVWFSLDGAHPVLKWLAELFPLTHLVTAARAIMVDGATLSEVMHHVTVLGGDDAAVSDAGRAAVPLGQGLSAALSRGSCRTAAAARTRRRAAARWPAAGRRASCR
jgi:ABC-2 type transport system permease protein